MHRWRTEVCLLAALTAACGPLESQSEAEVASGRAALVGSAEDRAFIAANAPNGRALLSLLDRRPDPTAVPQPDGTLRLTYTDAAGRQVTRVTDGADRSVRDWAADLRGVVARPNRVAVANKLLELLARNGVTPRDRRSPVDLDDAALVDLTRNLALELIALPLEDARVPSSLKCDEEVGVSPGFEDGTTTACKPTGLYRHPTNRFWMSPTCVRDQGRRGTCTAFAITAGVEQSLMAQWRPQSNLSEQHLYATQKVQRAEPYGDGLPLGQTLANLAASSYRFPYESAWTYNPSGVRLDTGLSYLWSCNGYTGLRCSDSTSQATVVSPPGAPVVWDTSVPSTTSVGVQQPLGLGTDDVSMLVARAFLSQRIVLAMGTALTTSFALTTTNGRVPWMPAQLDAFDGSHAMLVVGFVHNAALPQAQWGAGHGYFIVKNSWGCDFGDAGYVYVPEGYFQAHGYSLQTVIAN